MKLPKLQINHDEENLMRQFTFYIFSKEPQLGQPNVLPWKEGFAVICANQEAYDFFFWLASALHTNGYFKASRKFIGIPQLSIEDTNSLISELTPVMLPTWQQYQVLLHQFDKLQGKRITLSQQVEQSNGLQKKLLLDYFGA